MVLSRGEFYSTPGDMVRLFVQESERVIRDRLINVTELEVCVVCVCVARLCLTR